jgi:hypothetical protein
MSRYARLLGAVLVFGVPPVAGLAQSGGPAATPSPPALERRPVAPRAEADPWLIAFAGLGNRTARANLAQLDGALARYDAGYTRLPPEDRARVRQAFDDLLPRQSISRYPLTESQARAIAYLALGPWERRRADGDCAGPRRRPAGCGPALDSMSRRAAWIHSTVLALGRPANRRPRAQELADLHAMNEMAGEMVLKSPGCGCPAARGDADQLLAATREAVDLYQTSAMPAWMRLGDQRVQHMARVSDSLERTYNRCLGDR